MANNPNSFYIGVPTTSVQSPISYDSPKYIQVIGSSNSVEDVSSYYDWSMTLTTSTGVSSLYIVHYCNAQSSGYNSNWTSYASQGKIFAHNGSGQYYNSIDSLPAGTKYWTARKDSFTGINSNAWPNDFGNENDWGIYNVEVYLFNDALVAEEKTTITLHPAGGSGGTNTVYGTNGKYLPSITIPTRTGYSFEGYGNTSNGSETGTLYYDSSGNPTRNWTQTGGIATLYAKWRNTITYNPYSGSCWAVDAKTPGTATTGSRTITIASSSSCTSGGAITFSISRSGWTISSDGKTLTVPSNTPVGVYSINIKAESPSSTSVTGYMKQIITRTISITVKSGGATYSGIYITNEKFTFEPGNLLTPESEGYGEYYYDEIYGEVVEPGPMEFSWFMPKSDDYGDDMMIPAGQITIDGSNIGNYIKTLIYGYQKITYKDGTEDWVEVPLTWGGSHTFESLGTELTEEQITKFGRDITFTFSGGNQVVTFNLDDYLSSIANIEGYNYTIYREPNSCTWGTPSVSTTYQTKYPSGGGKIVLSKENIIISNQEGVWTSGSVSTNTSLTKLQFTQTTSASGFTPKIENNNTANATLTNEASAASSTRTGNKITIKAYGQGDKYTTVYAEFSQNGPNGITITSSCPQTIYSRSGYNTCTVSVTGATGTVSYASLNTSIATVNSSGVVTYVGPGTATIRVSATGNENIDSKYVDCQVNCVEDTYTCTITKPSISQPNDLPCSGITLTADNIINYFSASATVNRTWASGYTDTASPSSYTWTITKGEVASRGTTIDNNKTNVSINIKVTAKYNSCSSQSDAVTSGRQAANPITSYSKVNAPTITQETDFPCKGVTLTTSNISIYFKISATQQVTLCSGSKTNISATGYTWTITNGEVASRGTTIDDNKTNVSINISATASGGGNGTTSNSTSVTSGTQAANPIKTYGSVNTPIITQETNFPCKGVTLSNSNIATYFKYSATQNVELCSGSTTIINVPASGLSWTYTDATIAGWGNTYSESTREVIDFNITLTATGGGNRSNTKRVTSGTQAANPIKTYGAVGTPTIKQEKEFPCGGVTLTTSNISTYFSYSPVTQSVTLCSDGTTTIEVKEYTWSGSNVSIPSLGKTTKSGVTERAISFTITAKGGENKSATATVSKGNQAANPASDTWNDISITTYRYPNIGAGGGTSNPTITASQSGTRTWCSGETEGLTGTLSYRYSMTTGDGFSIDTSTGDITAEDRGTTPGVARTSNTATVTVTGGGNMTKDATATCTQGANELEGITLTVGSKTISYQGTTKGTVTARYTSGSTKDVENDTNTSYTANPNIVTFNKTS